MISIAAKNNDHGIEDPGGRDTFGVGWDEAQHRLDRTDVNLAYAYVLGREDRLPYVFTDMNTLPSAQQDDRFDDRGRDKAYAHLLSSVLV